MSIIEEIENAILSIDERLQAFILPLYEQLHEGDPEKPQALDRSPAALQLYRYKRHKGEERDKFIVRIKKEIEQSKNDHPMNLPLLKNFENILTKNTVELFQIQKKQIQDFCCKIEKTLDFYRFIFVFCKDNKSSEHHLKESSVLCVIENIKNEISELEIEFLAMLNSFFTMAALFFSEIQEIKEDNFCGAMTQIKPIDAVLSDLFFGVRDDLDIANRTKENYLQRLEALSGILQWDWPEPLPEIVASQVSIESRPVLDLVKSKMQQLVSMAVNAVIAEDQDRSRSIVKKYEFIKNFSVSFKNSKASREFAEQTIAMNTPYYLEDCLAQLGETSENSKCKKAGELLASFIDKLNNFSRNFNQASMTLTRNSSMSSFFVQNKEDQADAQKALSQKLYHFEYQRLPILLENMLDALEASMEAVGASDEYKSKIAELPFASLSEVWIQLMFAFNRPYRCVENGKINHYSFDFEKIKAPLKAYQKRVEAFMALFDSNLLLELEQNKCTEMPIDEADSVLASSELIELFDPNILMFNNSVAKLEEIRLQLAGLQEQDAHEKNIMRGVASTLLDLLVALNEQHTALLNQPFFKPLAYFISILNRLLYSIEGTPPHYELEILIRRAEKAALAVVQEAKHLFKNQKNTKQVGAEFLNQRGLFSDRSFSHVQDSSSSSSSSSSSALPPPRP